MPSFKTSVCLVVAGLAASACGPATNGITPVSNPALESANQPVVQRTDYVLDVSTNGGGVPDAELDRLSAWFDSLQLGYGDRVSIDQPAGYADARSVDDIASVVGDYGLLLSQGAPVTAGSVQPGSARIVVSRMTASVPGCPIWEDEIVGAPERTATNYGCAVNSNLAAMIADPGDLVLGQTGSGDRNAATGSRAIKTYREKKPTGADPLKSVTTGGK